MAARGLFLRHGVLACVGMGLIGCESAPPADTRPAEPDRATAIAAAEAQEQQVAQTPSLAPAQTPADASAPRTGVAPPVLLVWDNISDLYRSFFSKTEVVANLSEGLTGYANGPVNLHIRWDEAALVGTIRLRILPDTLIDPQLGEGKKVPLQALAPLTTAIATYRAEVASRFDIRVASFSVALESFSGARHCVFPVVGTPPPDGRLLSPCVQLNGEERCGTPQPDGVVFAADVAEDLRACLRPQG